jgi:hypothetical protein
MYIEVGLRNIMSETKHHSTRLYQITLIASFLYLSWLGMQIVHELGHILGACLTGGSVERVVLHPFAISRTDGGPDNPHPLIEVWMGPMVGVLIPLLAWALARALRAPGLYLVRFFAGFCLVVNGVYLGVGGFVGTGDAGDLLVFGAARWQLLLFGLATTPLGLYLWHGQGPHFGLGKPQGRVDRRVTLVSLGLLVLVSALELILIPR